MNCPFNFRKGLSMLKGVTNSFQVVLTQELEVLTLLMGVSKGFHPLKKGGSQQVLRCLEGGGRKQFVTRRFLMLCLYL